MAIVVVSSLDRLGPGFRASPMRMPFRAMGTAGKNGSNKSKGL